MTVSTEQAKIRVGVIAAPGDAATRLERWIASLGERLGQIYSSQAWDLEFRVDGLVAPTSSSAVLIDRARELLIDKSWDFAVVVTDIPVHSGRRPSAFLVSDTHGIGVASWPALGPLFSQTRVVNAICQLIGDVAGALPSGERSPVNGERDTRPWKTRSLAARLQLRQRNGTEATSGMRVGYLRMFLGMVVSNRPWRVGITLTKSLAAALATIAFADVTFDVWTVALDASLPRLLLLTLVSIGLATAGLMVRHDLWERSDNPTGWRQTSLFNLVTLTTLATGLTMLYMALFLLALLSGWLLVPDATLRHAVSPDAMYWVDRLGAAWFVASLATFGGAVGAGLESEDAIQLAAYSTRPLESDHDRLGS
jgi:hypothetical protein